MVVGFQTNSISGLPVINTHVTPQSLGSLLGIDYLFFDRSCKRKEPILSMVKLSEITALPILLQETGPYLISEDERPGHKDTADCLGISSGTTTGLLSSFFLQG